MLGIDTNYPRRTFRVRDLTAGQVTMRQTIIWYPTADAREAVSRNMTTKGGGRATRAVLATTQENLPLHVFTGEPGDRLGGAGIGTAWAGGERVGRKVRFRWREWSMRRRGVLGPEGATSEELEPEKAFVSEPEADESGEDSFDGEREPKLDQDGQSGAHQELPAAVRKLYDSFTVVPQPITQSRTRSGHDTASLQAPMGAVDVNHLPPEPTTLREAQASPEWPNWQRVRSASTIAPPHASDGFKTDSAPFPPHPYLFCWFDLFMWILS